MQNKQYILFVSGLDKNVKEADLHKLFTEYPVSYIKIAKDHQTKESYGYAFIGIKNSANKAEEAIDRFNYEKMPGYKKTIKVCWYNMDRTATKNKEDLNVFVKNIDKSVSHKEFHELYSQFGNITSLKISEDEEGESLGYGFVLYETSEDAQKAIEATNGMNLHGKALWAGKSIEQLANEWEEDNNQYINDWNKTNLCQRWEYKTPGAMIADRATNVVNYQDNLLLRAEDLNDAIAAVIDALLNRFSQDIMNKGFSGVNYPNSGNFYIDGSVGDTTFSSQTSDDFPEYILQSSSWLQENADFNIRTDLTQAVIDEQRIFY